ncbi:DUF3375 domain-containing protein [Agromyces sp. H66]|uniref:DUF3375 domain-containing protein n=1 Tax=Agromyces sp. H66 TaxID=2529859 RepID=UPI0010AA421D|nr:DUF3375 domain-containing protein [Agromyces sp. H66]
MSSVTSTSLALSRLLDDDASWRLLRADNAPVIAALLSEHLGGEPQRLPADELFEVLDHDLERLREAGFELRRNAQGYCAEWREAGFLVRRPSEEARGETYELSPGALQAIRYLEQLATPRQTATESRLASIAAQLGRLAVDTDPDATRRLAQLHAERDRIDQAIERIHAGELETLDPSRALERIRDILAQAEEIPADFARVRAEFEELNRSVRAGIVESDATQRAVLDDIFRGVDHIAESEAGRSFAGFSALVLDAELGAAFDEHMTQVLEREFADSLTPSQRRFLRRYVRVLKERSGEIQDVITTFARGLRRYVQSQDFQRDRVLQRLLREALGAGLAASARTKPYRVTGLELSLSTVSMSSAGALRLHDPAELDASAPVEVRETATADLAALRALARETEIDFDELTGHVNAVLGELDTCTVGEVLARHPASQGVASVVGLIALAAANGVVTDDTEPVRWQGRDGRARAATIPVHRFTGRVL